MLSEEELLAIELEITNRTFEDDEDEGFCYVKGQE